MFGLYLFQVHVINNLFFIASSSLLSVNTLLDFQARFCCFRRNFVEPNIYMRDLRIEEREQQKAYLLIDLLSKAR